jgi:hypothetical protein
MNAASKDRTVVEDAAASIHKSSMKFGNVREQNMFFITKVIFISYLHKIK